MTNSRGSPLVHRGRSTDPRPRLSVPRESGLQPIKVADSASRPGAGRRQPQPGPPGPDGLRRSRRVRCPGHGAVSAARRCNAAGRRQGAGLEQGAHILQRLVESRQQVIAVAVEPFAGMGQAGQARRARPDGYPTSVCAQFQHRPAALGVAPAGFHLGGYSIPEMAGSTANR